MQRIPPPPRVLSFHRFSSYTRSYSAFHSSKPRNGISPQRLFVIRCISSRHCSHNIKRHIHLIKIVWDKTYSDYVRDRSYTGCVEHKLWAPYAFHRIDFQPAYRVLWLVLTIRGLGCGFCASRRAESELLVRLVVQHAIE